MWPSGRGVTRRPPRPGTASAEALPWHLVPGPTLALLAGNGPAKKSAGRGGGGCGGLGQEDSAVRQELGKEGKELRGGSATLPQSLVSGAARDWWRRDPQKPQMRDAPRPEQLEEQLCVRCGGVRIFALAFDGFGCFLRFQRQGKRFGPVYCGVSPTGKRKAGQRGLSHIPMSRTARVSPPTRHDRSVLRERSQGGCLGRIPALHAQACAFQAGSGSQRPARGRR